METERDDGSAATRHGGLGCESNPIYVVQGPIHCTASGHVERSLTLSWPDKSFQPRSQVAQLRPGTVGVGTFWR